MALWLIEYDVNVTIDVANILYWQITIINRQAPITEIFVCGTWVKPLEIVPIQPISVVDPGQSVADLLVEFGLKPGDERMATR